MRIVANAIQAFGQAAQEDRQSRYGLLASHHHRMLELTRKFAAHDAKQLLLQARHLGRHLGQRLERNLANNRSFEHFGGAAMTPVGQSIKSDQFAGQVETQYQFAPFKVDKARLHRADRQAQFAGGSGHRTQLVGADEQLEVREHGPGHAISI